MRLPIKPLPFKPPRLNGLPRALTDQQFEKHYGEALRRYNTLADSGPHGNATAMSLLRVDLSLHELALASLTDEETPLPQPLADRITRDLGSASAIQERMMTTAERRQDGWLTLCSTPSQSLELYWCPAGTGLPANLSAMLAFDLSPHIWEPFFPDDPGSYAENLLSNTKWSAVADTELSQTTRAESATETAPVCSPEELVNAMNAPSTFQVFDVRQIEDLSSDDTQVAGSSWHNPQKIKELAASLDKESEVIVYCVYGGWVSLEAADALRSHGINARALAGGYSSWLALDLPQQSLDAAARDVTE